MAKHRDKRREESSPLLPVQPIYPLQPAPPFYPAPELELEAELLGEQEHPAD